MGNQSIVTEKVSAVANQLRSVNKAINQAFADMEKSAKALGSAWNSPAGSSAETKKYEIFKANTDRSTVLENYADMLLEVVNPNYDSTESVNKKLADQFK